MRLRPTVPVRFDTRTLSRLGGWAWGLLVDTALLGGLLVVAEVAGREIHADWQGALVFFAALLLWAPFFFGRSASPLASGLRRLARNAANGIRKRLRLQLGFDFRPQRTDPPFLGLHGVSLTVSASLAATMLLAPLLPGAFGALQDLSGAVVLAALGALWTVLLLVGGFCILIAVFLFQALASEYELRDNPASSRRRRRFPARIAAGYAAGFVSVILLETVVGPAAPFAAAAALALLHLGLGLLPSHGGTPAVLVHNKRKKSSGRITLFTLEHLSIFASGVAVLTVAAFGSGALTVPRLPWLPAFDPHSPVSLDATVFLGRATVWIALLVLVPVSARSLTARHRARRRDPARPRRKTLSHGPSFPASILPSPWRSSPCAVSPPAHRADLDYDPEGRRKRTQGPPPLPRPLENLSPPERLFTLDHFDFVTKRRLFYRGLSRLMKIAAGLDFLSGGGYLLCPHHLFIEGLHRDDPGGAEGEPRIIGPPFHTLWGLRTRQFLHEVLTKLKIDLIFYEEDVRWPALRKVLDQMFERYLQRPDDGPLQESDFRFLMGVRVFIEDLVPEKPKEIREEYDEPAFANLSRARVLMVYRDRGGQEDPSREDAPREKVPAPMFG